MAGCDHAGGKEAERGVSKVYPLHWSNLSHEQQRPIGLPRRCWSVVMDLCPRSKSHHGDRARDC